MSKNKKAIIAASIILGLCSCAAVSVFLGFKIFWPPGAVDCYWSDTALAWIDENRNGTWDKNEKPLANVQFITDDILHDYDTSGDAISNENGKAGVYVFPVECGGYDETKIVMKAIPPEGYESTTPNEITVPLEKLDNNKNDSFPFGFIQKGQ